MSADRYRIEYGSSALDDLDSLAERARMQILRKIERLKSGLHAISNTFAGPMWRIDYGAATIVSCLTWRVTLSLSAESEIVRACMTKTLQTRTWPDGCERNGNSFLSSARKSENFSTIWML